MNVEENQIVKYINTEGFITVTKDTPKNEQDFIRKLKAFGILQVSPKNNYQYNPSSVFYKHYDSLLVWEGKIEEYQFENKSPSSIVNNFNGATFTQFNQHSNQISFEQINPVFIEALNQELSKEQLAIIKELFLNNSDKKTIIQTLGSFGKDILSNIIANVITNPNQYY